MTPSAFGAAAEATVVFSIYENYEVVEDLLFT